MSMTLSGAVGRDLHTDASVIPKQQALNTDSAAVRDLPLCLQSLSDSLKLARVACIDESEAYFGGADPSTCVGPRNEGAAISLLQQRLRSERDNTCGICQCNLKFSKQLAGLWLDESVRLPSYLSKEHLHAAAGTTIGFKRDLAAHTQQLTDYAFASYNQNHALSPASGEDSGAGQRASLMQ